MKRKELLYQTEFITAAIDENHLVRVRCIAKDDRVFYFWFTRISHAREFVTRFDGGYLHTPAFWAKKRTPLNTREAALKVVHDNPLYKFMLYR